VSTELRFHVSLAKAVEPAVMHVVEAGAVIVREHVVDQMEPGPTRTGITYPIPGTGASYTASAPGQPPAVREGRYVASWKSTPAVRNGDFVRARAYTDLMVDGWVLGDLLEHGTIRMLPRPHVRPGMEAARADVEALLVSASRHAPVTNPSRLLGPG
jgi:hypothetical protein